jgi:hypothetical protein
MVCIINLGWDIGKYYLAIFDIKLGMLFGDDLTYCSEKSDLLL